jgi:2-oxoglutarate dehydrogenase complex dehydrogenase (E1) component-like enzyme
MKSKKTNTLTDLGFLSGGNLSYLESLYQELESEEQNDQNLDLAESWKSVFSSLPEFFADGGSAGESVSQAWFESSAHKQANVQKLIMAFRSLGHLLADVDPIGSQ